MKYKYCPKCDSLRPRTFLMDDRCESCRGEALTIEVRRSIYGRAMYVTSAIAIALIILYLAYRDYGIGLASFVSSIGEGPYVALVFFVILVSFALSFLDLGRTNAAARRIVDERKGRIHE